MSAAEAPLNLFTLQSLTGQEAGNVTQAYDANADGVLSDEELRQAFDDGVLYYDGDELRVNQTVLARKQAVDLLASVE